MLKRTIIALLWLLAAWTFGGMLSVFAGAPPLLGPAAGILLGALVWWDPAGWMWTRPAAATPALGRRLADLERMPPEPPAGDVQHETGSAQV